MLSNQKALCYCALLFGLASHAILVEAQTGGGTPIDEDDDTEVDFMLFTKDDIKSAKATSKIDDSGKIFNGVLDTTKTTKVLIHGWMDTWQKTFAQTMLNAFLPRFDYNVIVVNWPEADDPLYVPSRLKVPTVGQIVGRFLQRLREDYNISSSTLHVLGHSLGAHVAAVAGYTLIEAGEDQIGRLTGLDPALPLFTVGGGDTLSRVAADFVEVVHSCARAAAIYEALGDVDFYPNGGGPLQPGCGIDLRCSHLRSFQYYGEGIENSKAFLGKLCVDWETYEKGDCKETASLYMNGDIPTSARGSYFFSTNASPPYGLGPVMETLPTTENGDENTENNDGHNTHLIRVQLIT